METSLLGETQIVDNAGNVVKRLTMDDGQGVIVADIDLSPTTPTISIPTCFWAVNLPPLFRFTWAQQNFACESIYKQAKAAGKF